jgi:CTP:molybdopterin cytidylyltransferase MocA
MTITGIVLAAGAGTRMGTPKALKRNADGVAWLDTAVAVLEAAGCDPVLVVLGAAPDAPVPPGARAILAADWADGLSASLRAGLAAADGDAALVTLVDLPSLPLAVVARVVASGSPLAQAVYDGRPGHPVLIARDHWSGVTELLAGDRGARQYLVQHGVTEVECGDLWDGADVDS